MNKTLLGSFCLTLLGCFAACGSDSNTNSSDSGSDLGFPLLNISSEPEGDNCLYGGSKITAGRDENHNGKLDTVEVQTTSYLCSPAPGVPGVPGDDGDNGPAGEDGDQGIRGARGAKGSVGPQGPEGPQGPQGDAGADGLNLLIAVTPEAAGDNCEFGGQRIDTGLDADRDAVLDAGEISDTAYVCDGHPATVGGFAGFRLVSKYVAPGGPIAEIVSASPDGNTLVYTSSSTGTIGFADITDPTNPTLLGTTDLSAVTTGTGEPTSVAFSPNGTHAVAVVKDTANSLDADPGAMVVVDAATRTIVGSVAVGVGPDGIHLTPDGSKAVIAIEDEEDPDGNDAAQSRTGKVQVVAIDYTTPANSVVVDVPLGVPALGNMPSDLQPEFVDITKDGKTAVVTLQENNLVAVIDLQSNTVTRYIDLGTSLHAKADNLDDELWDFSESFEGQLQPDGICLLPDGVHFITANEGDTPNGVFGGVSAGGRGYSLFRTDGTRVFDSGDSLEWAFFRSGAYPDSRSDARGVEPEGCGTGTFGGKPYAFIAGERNASLAILNVGDPANPVLEQIMGAPERPEAIVAIESRNLFVVAGEGDGAVAGGGIWIYQAVSDPLDVGHGPNVYDPRSTGTYFAGLSGLTYQQSTGFLLAVPDNAFPDARVWSFAVDHTSRRVNLVDELMLRDSTGVQLSGIDPEGIVENPEGGFIVATEGVAANGGGGATCTAGPTSNRILFFEDNGRLDDGYGIGGIVDLPCGGDVNAFDWDLMPGNGFEGVTVTDSLPSASGGLKIYVAFQRPLTGEASLTRIGEYDVDAGEWNFYFYELDPDVGGVSGNTFLSELIHVGSDKFAVIERDQGISNGALNKTVRTFTLSSGTLNDSGAPVEKETAIDLLADPFRFDQEKIEGLALGGGSLWVVNDNDGGEYQNFFMRFSPQLLGGASPEVAPDVVINEVNSTNTLYANDFVELYNRSGDAADLSGWKVIDEGDNEFVIPPGTILAADDYLLLESLGFGLGSGDGARLYTAQGTLVDSYSWTSHVASHSRCAGTGLLFWPTDELNGAGSPTPGDENDCQSPTVAGSTSVVINEINSSGNDFVELYNNDLVNPVDLSNWKVTDDNPTHVYVLPQGTTIAAGGFLVIEGDWTTDPPALDFGLGQGDHATLSTPYDELVDDQTWSGHAQTSSRCPDGSGGFVNPTPATKGGANSCG